MENTECTDITPLTVAEVNLGQLSENYKIIKAAVSDSRVLCIVKADAYGHGAVRCSAALRESGADFFGVANLTEAIELRQNGIGCDIIILGYTPPADAPLLARFGIIQTVFSPGYAQDLSCCLGAGEFLRCHMKIDTGMNRLGFRAAGGQTGDCSLDSMLAGMTEAACLPHLVFNGIYTHLACADTLSSPMTQTQYRRFTDTIDALASRGITFETRHVINSAGIINYPEMKLDAVRAGILLYGLRPSHETGTGGCIPIMTLRATVSHIHDLPAGESVSYGATYTAECPKRLATLAIGYADGFVRTYAGRGGVFFGDQRAPIVGRICMDQCMADITGIGGVYPGMHAVIFDSVHTADLIAEAGGTINYEVTSILTQRVKRVYI